MFNLSKKFCGLTHWDQPESRSAPILSAQSNDRSAATVSVAAQASHLAQGAPLAPRLQAKAESFRLGSREYPTTAHSRPEDIAKNSREPDRPQNGAQRAGHPEPPRVQTAHGADTGIRLPSGSGLDGGVSGTAPAVGSDAGQRGGSARSPDSPPALGQDAINIGENATSRIMDSPAPPNGNYTGASEHYRSGYTRMRRMYRHVNTHSASKYADPLSGSDGESTGLALTEQELTTDDSGSSDDGSGNDGADGTITKGIARPGSGLDGGHAETGEPGSSKGGHVYNSPGAQ